MRRLARIRQSGMVPPWKREREMIAEIAHRNRRHVWNCLPKQVHAGCLDFAAVVTCPAFATILENGRFDKCHGAARMAEKRRKAVIIA